MKTGWYGTRISFEDHKLSGVVAPPLYSRRPRQQTQSEIATFLSLLLVLLLSVWEDLALQGDGEGRAASNHSQESAVFFYFFLLNLHCLLWFLGLKR